MAVRLPATQRALKVEGVGKVTMVDGEPLPHIDPDEVLVHVACVGLNPYDSKSLDMSPCPGATVGVDFAGEIAAVGDLVPINSLHIGDRVLGCVFGNNPDARENGAFADYVAVPAQLLFKIPCNLSFQQASTLGSGLAATGLALYQGLGLPMPLSDAATAPTTKFKTTTEPVVALVYGGGTATGALAIQMLRRSGVTPITTCSPRNFKRLKSLGAEEAFDYHSPTCGGDIREYTNDRLAFAMDCITSSASMKICYEAIGRKGGKYIALDPFPLHAHTRRSIQPDWIFLFTQFGKPIRWDRPFNFDVRQRDKDFAQRWYSVAEKLLADGQVVPHPHQEERGGLQAVADGIDAVRKGQVSGYKLVYPIRSCASS